MTDYLITTWTVDSDGSPCVNIFMYKTYESAIEHFNSEKNKILEISKNYKYELITIGTIDEEEEYANKDFKSGDFYIIDQTIIYENEISAFYQDFGFKRPKGVSLKILNTNQHDSNLNWSTRLLCYPFKHGGSW